DSFELVGDATRFENWEFAYALVLGQGAAAEYAGRVGVADAGRYASGLAQRAREQLANIEGVRVLDAGEELCAIVTVEIAGHDARDVVRMLREEAINTSALDRTSAVIDMDDKQAHSALRISPHYYNTQREIDIAVGAREAFVMGGAPWPERCTRSGRSFAHCGGKGGGRCRRGRRPRQVRRAPRSGRSGMRNR